MSLLCTALSFIHYLFRSTHIAMLLEALDENQFMLFSADTTCLQPIMSSNLKTFSPNNCL